MPARGKQAELLRQDGWITAAEVAEATGLHLSTIHTGIESEKIPGQRIGWGWYVDIWGYCEVTKQDWPPSSFIGARLRNLRSLVKRPQKVGAN